MFRGVPATQLTVVTEQDDCLPELRVREEWLFYLQRDEKAHSLVLAYGSLSKPIAEAAGDQYAPSYDRDERLGAHN